MNIFKGIKIFLMTAGILAFCFSTTACKNKKKKCDTCPQWGQVEMSTDNEHLFRA